MRRPPISSGNQGGALHRGSAYVPKTEIRQVQRCGHDSDARSRPPDPVGIVAARPVQRGLAQLGRRMARHAKRRGVLPRTRTMGPRFRTEPASATGPSP